jgi:hypothetical protein
MYIYASKRAAKRNCAKQPRREDECKQEAAPTHIFKNDHRKAVWKSYRHTVTAPSPFAAAARHTATCRRRRCVVPCLSCMLRFEAASALAINSNAQRQYQRCSGFLTWRFSNTQHQSCLFVTVYSLPFHPQRSRMHTSPGCAAVTCRRFHRNTSARRCPHGLLCPCSFPRNRVHGFQVIEAGALSAELIELQPQQQLDPPSIEARYSFESQEVYDA